MCVCSLGERIPQEMWLLSSRHLPQGVRSSIGVGSFQPSALPWVLCPRSAFLRLAYVHDAFWGAGG